MAGQTPSVAWLNLTHNPGRMILLLSGIVFAVILMFMFTGFKFALYDSQGNVSDLLFFIPKDAVMEVAAITETHQ